MRSEHVNNIPTSTVHEVNDSPEARRELLENLGYEFFDYGLHNAWLFFEESSAEKIVRDYLIPWFTSGLHNRVRTYSARSVNQVESKFDDFNRLFVFVHLQEIYKNRAWVIVDGGDNEEEIIQKMKEKYTPTGWSPDNFVNLEQHDFEQYYPERFKERTLEVLAIRSKREKYEAKIALFNEVEEWIESNQEEAKREFLKSAVEVIELLKKIEAAL